MNKRGVERDTTFVMKLSWVAILLAAVLAAGCQSSEANRGKNAAQTLPVAGAASEKAADSFDAGGRSSLSLNRQIIYTAHQEVRVDSVKKAEREAQDIVKKAGGFISSLDSNHQNEEFPRSSMTARVPSKGMDSVMTALAGLGREVSQSKTGEDVTDQLVDMEARLRALRAEETAYLEIMKASRKVTDIIEVQRELIRVRTEIERIDAQRVNLKDQVAFSTITLVLTQTAIDAPRPEGHWAADAWAGATSSMGAALRNLGSAGIWIAVYLPIWGACIGLPMWLAIFAARRMKKAKKPPVQ